MSLGDGILLSSVLLSTVILYAVTKDRWNWKRIFKWVIAAPAILIVLVVAGNYLHDTWQSRLSPQTDLDGFSLAATRADIKFAKGEPGKVEDENEWIYYTDDKRAGYQVRFKDNKVRYVMYYSADDKYVNPSVLNVTKGHTYEAVKSALGEPSHVDASSNGLLRSLSYDKYNVTYTFEKNKVVVYGIYDPKLGPLKFTKADGSD